MRYARNTRGSRKEYVAIESQDAVCSGFGFIGSCENVLVKPDNSREDKIIVLRGRKERIPSR